MNKNGQHSLGQCSIPWGTFCKYLHAYNLGSKNQPATEINAGLSRGTEIAMNENLSPKVEKMFL